MLKAFLRDERGATAIEYALLCAMIFLACLTGVTAYVNATDSMYDDIGTAVTDATGG